MLIKALRYFKDNYCYKITINNNFNILVDPGDTPYFINYFKKCEYNIDCLLLTHGHLDHIGNINNFLSEVNIKCVISGDNTDIKLDNYNIIKNPDKIDFSLINERTHFVFNTKKSFIFDNFRIDITPVPCHTLDSLFYNIISNENNIKEEIFNEYNIDTALLSNILLTGDTVFIGGCGRTFNGTHQEMLNNMSIARSYNSNTKFLTGHDYMINNLKFCDKYYTLTSKNNISKWIEKANYYDSKNITKQGFSLSELNEFNIFFMYDNNDLQKVYNFNTELELFSYLRKEKDLF